MKLKATQLIFSMFFFLLVQSAQGQSVSEDAFLAQKIENKFKKGSELGVSIGVPSFFYLFDGPFNDFNYDNNSLHDHFLNGGLWQGKSIISGVIGLTYTYRFKKWFELSGNISYLGQYTNHNNIYGEFVMKENHHYTSIVSIARFVWLNKKYVRLYSSIGLGMGFSNIKNSDGIKGNNHFNSHPSHQFTLLGIKAGKRVYGFAEVSFGNIGLVTIGVGYNFNY